MLTFKNHRVHLVSQLDEKISAKVDCHKPSAHIISVGQLDHAQSYVDLIFNYSPNYIVSFGECAEMFEELADWGAVDNDRHVLTIAERNSSWRDPLVQLLLFVDLKESHEIFLWDTKNFKFDETKVANLIKNQR